LTQILPDVCLFFLALCILCSELYFISMTKSTTRQYKKRIASRFDKAAKSYNSGAVVQREITRRLASLIKDNIGSGQLWCDIGSAAGALVEDLMPLPQRTKFVCLDIAFSPLRLAAQRGRNSLAINGDIDFPPIRPASLDGAVAASMLQWVSSPKLALCKISQLLKQDGVLYFAVFIEDSFKEINTLRSNRGLPSVVWLPSESELFSVFESAGFHILKESIQPFHKTLQFTDAISALKSLSSIGATATAGKLLNRKELEELCTDYTSMFSKNGTVPLTYYSIIGKAQKKADTK
ncbi:MAG: methyltransferase domain-containing protein, partial [Chitinispirillia bacterium]|nr:methyltransferase domain-containing protein [Chitinispirillia bacterium]